jgi:hypothetical protein
MWIPISLAAELDRPATGDQVDDQHDNGDDQEQVNETAGHVKAESQDPEDQQDYEDCPEHAITSPFLDTTRPRETTQTPGAHQRLDAGFKETRNGCVRKRLRNVA